MATTILGVIRPKPTNSAFTISSEHLQECLPRPRLRGELRPWLLSSPGIFFLLFFHAVLVLTETTGDSLLSCGIVGGEWPVAQGHEAGGIP